MEDQFAGELKQLLKEDDKPKPTNWVLSPWAVLTYIIGGKLKSGFDVSTKYYGNKHLIEVAIATLATDRALLLLGIPGTGKTWLAEHISAAISGNSARLIQGTAGLTEDALRYHWNYAELISKGPSEKALIPSPVFGAMQEGKIVRIEELTRLNPDVQDSLITILSEKTIPIPELNTEVMAMKGFNIIATANDKDQGVNTLSSALKRRFNTVVLPLPATLKQEVVIVKDRVKAIGQRLEIPAAPPPEKEIKRLITIFRELRNGETEDGAIKLKRPSSTLSTAEAISVINSGQALAAHFSNGKLTVNELASGMIGAIVKDPEKDTPIWEEYVESVIKTRKPWRDLYKALSQLTTS